MKVTNLWFDLNRQAEEFGQIEVLLYVKIYIYCNCVVLKGAKLWTKLQEETDIKLDWQRIRFILRYRVNCNCVRLQGTNLSNWTEKQRSYADRRFVLLWGIL